MKKIPFYANTPDDLNCFPASFRMILKYFLPDREFSWEQLDSMSAHIPGMSTWPQAMMIELEKLGFDVVMIEGFDAEAFIQEGASYLKKEFGEETAQWQITHSSIAAEQKHFKNLLDTNVSYKQVIPSIDEIEKYLDKGYLVNCVVNSRKLNGQEGYVGHSVVVFDSDGVNLTLHDPGLPPQQNRIVNYVDFEKAWAYPNDKAKNLIAVKLVRYES